MPTCQCAPLCWSEYKIETAHMTQSPEIHGLQFPQDKQGKRSTMATSQLIFSQSVNATHKAFANSILHEPNWRKEYGRYIADLTRIATQSVECSENIAQAGLATCYQQFRFHRDGHDYDLKTAMEKLNRPLLHTACIEGQAPSNSALDVEHKGRLLNKDSLRAQISRWMQKGIIDSSHAHDLYALLAKPEVQDLSDHYFVLLGATSEIGPLSCLLQLGANVIAVSRHNPISWQRLIRLTRQSSGRLFIPCSSDPRDLSDTQIANLAGADLLVQAPEIANWINRFEHPLVIGNYGYLDGADHVRITMAMDAIIDQLLSKRNDISLAYLLTPTDVYAVSSSIVEVAAKRTSLLTLGGNVKLLLNKISFGQLFSKMLHSSVIDEQGRQFGVMDNLVHQQGPNYVLAKRIQRWRAIDSVKKGITVSCNVAPASNTQSVMSNVFFAAASKGSESFGIEVFSPKTVNVLMTMQLIHDIKLGLQSRGEALFIHGANHGGAWSIGYNMRSLLVLSLVVGLIKKVKLSAIKTKLFKAQKRPAITI